MTLKKRTIEFLLKPPMWLCVVVWVIGAIGIAGSITLYYLGLGLEMWALPVHISALLFLILSVYAVLTVIGVPERAKNSVSVKKFFSSYSTRAFVYASCSIIFNGCYVAFGIVIVVLTHSPWLGVLVGYHIFLLLPRVLVMFPKFRTRNDADVDIQKQQLRSYAYSGLMLVLLALAFLPVIRMTLEGQNSYHYVISTVAYVSGIAAYTFTKLGISVYNLKKVRGNSDYSLRTVKNVSFADALISLFALQAMMLKELDTSDGYMALASKMNPAIGVIISVVILSMGLYMLIKGIKLLKARGKESGAQDEKTPPDEEPCDGGESAIDT